VITCNRIPLSPATKLRCVVANLKLCGGDALIRGDIAKLRDYVDEFAGVRWSFFLIKPFGMEKALTNLKVCEDLVVGEQNPNPLE
jgi:hypothetical protein